MPMSRRRVTTVAASLVWIVEKTRWPVWAAWIAMRAVSTSRTSPTIMMSGSWRSSERRPEAKVRPFFSFTWIWLMPWRWYSIGSSIVITFICVELMRESEA